MEIVNVKFCLHKVYPINVFVYPLIYKCVYICVRLILLLFSGAVFCSHSNNACEWEMLFLEIKCKYIRYMCVSSSAWLCIVQLHVEHAAQGIE